jgi:hypothetical protein
MCGRIGRAHEGASLPARPDSVRSSAGIAMATPIATGPTPSLLLPARQPRASQVRRRPRPVQDGPESIRTQLRAVMKPNLAVASADGHGLRCSVARDTDAMPSARSSPVRAMVGPRPTWHPWTGLMRFER